MGLISSGVVVDLWVLAKVIKECSFLIGWLVDQFKTTGTVRDVSVSSTSIIRIVNWLRVNVSKRFSWSLLGGNE